MKTIKSQLILHLLFATLVSCNFSGSQNNETGLEKNNSLTQKGLKYNSVYDHKNGLIICQSPLPESWEYDSQKSAQITITAPNGIKVNKTETHNYAYANDQFSLQSLQQVSQNLEISPVIPLNEILHNYILPSAQSQGYELIDSYKLPDVLRFWNQFESGMLKTGSAKQYNVLGTDWKGTNGKKSFIVIVQSIITKGNFIYWTLQSTELEAPQDYFKEAKNAYIFGLANTQINMEWQQTKNRELLMSIRNNNRFWENATRQSQIAHNQRMAVIESRGNAARSIGKTYSDILDINHAGYLKRNDMNSVGHSKSVNMIGERATISNMATGEHYNVKDGSKFYWVNTNGEYFGTDNAFYDPRADNRINNSEWSQFEIEN